nr:MAG TPA: hypothetical protein [Caudoviricetes sp.]
METDEKKDTLYLCDPQKNTACPRCWYMVWWL